tara:strand:+ start:794 stop:1141 length:348 start_codon:yes stop_codon:yes gene_type:complete
MSTYYRPTEPIPLADIKKNKSLQKQGFTVVEKDHKKTRYFICEENCLHFATDKQDNVIDLFRYGMNNPDYILDPLAEEFEVDFVSEYDDEYEDYYHSDTPVISIAIGDLIEANKT